MLLGLGARYFFGENRFTPFLGAHLNVHLEADVSLSADGTSLSAGVPGSSGFGIDLGGGGQFAINDTFLAEALLYYSPQLTGEYKLSTLALGVGVGAVF